MVKVAVEIKSGAACFRTGEHEELELQGGAVGKRTATKIRLLGGAWAASC